MDQVTEKVVSTLADRALAVVTDGVMQVVAILLVATVLAILWTGRKKAEYVALLGEAATDDPKVRWRLRNYSFWWGTSIAFVLLILFLPTLVEPEAPWWLRAVAKVALAAVLAPAGGLFCHPAWKVYTLVLAPIGLLIAKGVLDRVATWAAQRKARAKTTGDGGVGISADEADASGERPKTEYLGVARGASTNTAANGQATGEQTLPGQTAQE